MPFSIIPMQLIYTVLFLEFATSPAFETQKALFSPNASLPAVHTSPGTINYLSWSSRV